MNFQGWIVYGDNLGACRLNFAVRASCIKLYPFFPITFLMLSEVPVANGV